MNFRERLAEQLMRDEGLRLTAYQDSQGVWTIGVGHNLEARAIPRPAALLIFDQDLSDALGDVVRHLPWSAELADARRGVLANMAFNLGIGGLLSFRKFLAAVRVADWDAAAREMLDSVWATQVGERALRLAEQMRIGEWR